VILEILFGPRDCEPRLLPAEELIAIPALPGADARLIDQQALTQRGLRRVGVRCNVPCKLNLFLEVVRRRDDGYHDLDTVMHAVSLTDSLDWFDADADDLSMSLDVSRADVLPYPDPAWNIPTDASNLVLRAMESLRRRCGGRGGAHVVLRKRIPSQAGLGGGSADAAAALVLGSLAWQSAWEPEPLAEIAAGLGSDINFFLEGHAGVSWLARCRGRGEQIAPHALARPLWFVLVHPPMGCHTGSIFRALADSQGLESPRKSSDTIVQALAAPGELLASARTYEEHVGRLLYNRLEGAAKLATRRSVASSQGFDWLDATERRMERYNPLGQCMTGSGSARFCLCPDREQAEKIASDLRSFRDMRVYVVHSWESPPISDQIETVRRSVRE
jgi:4-diphosphocytidyl-2-C-methyl-D-erythritol kinase